MSIFRSLAMARCLRSLGCLALLTLLGCQDRAYVIVSLTGITDQTLTLRTLLANGNKVSEQVPEISAAGYAAKPGATPTPFRFAVRPPPGLAGALEISVAAYDQKGCLSATGATSLELLDGTKQSDIQLALVPVQGPSSLLCEPRRPLIVSAVQKETDVTKLAVTGWGFAPGATLLLDNQPLANVKRASFLELEADLPALLSPTGVLRAPLVVRNTDGSSYGTTLRLNTLAFASLPRNSYLLPMGRDPKSIAIGDVNGDDANDIVLTGLNASPTNGFIAVYINNGNGIFPEQPDYYDFNGSGETVIVTDLNGDSKNDIAVTSQSSNQVLIFYNPGGAKPAFVAQRFPGGSQPDQLLSGDYDGDGKIDLVTASRSVGGGSAVYILLNQGTSFPATAPTPLSLLGLIVSDLVFRDLNRDARPDLVLSHLGAAINGMGNTVLRQYLEPYWNRGGAMPMTGGAGYEIPGSLGRLAAGDMDNDTIPDLISTGLYMGDTAATQVDSSKLIIYINKGDENLALPRFDIETLVRPFTLAVGDACANAVVAPDAHIRTPRRGSRSGAAAERRTLSG